MRRISFFLTTILFAVMANADADCERALKQAEKTCQTDHNCKVQYMTVSGFDVVYTAGSINCRGSQSQAGKTVENSDFLPTRDRGQEKQKKKTLKIED